MAATKPVAASFRDPAGFVFHEGAELYREVKESYRPHYDLLNSSGLYDELVESNLLIPHETMPGQKPSPDTYLVLKPERIPFISYPYEWCFGQLKDAALATLQIQQAAMAKGMSLKDASAYNIQWRNGRPVLIDSLSFETIDPAKPWIAYAQFCRHFLAPLAIMAYSDPRTLLLFQSYVDGIPLDLAARLLPKRTWLRPGLALHLHLHARMQHRHSAGGSKSARRQTAMKRNGLQGLIDNLRGTVENLRIKIPASEWGEYYSSTNYDEEAFESKKKLVREHIGAVKPGSVWDLGANTGQFSAIAAESSRFVLALDADGPALERHYAALKQTGTRNILPLFIDLTNPSPASGWDGNERNSLVQRGPADLLLCLALVHHLAIAHNVPLERIAKFLSRIGNSLIIEFVPKNDSQVQNMLASRQDIFPNYTRERFEAAFTQYFAIERSTLIPGTKRHLFLMRRI